MDETNPKGRSDIPSLSQASEIKRLKEELDKKEAENEKLREQMNPDRDEEFQRLQLLSYEQAEKLKELAASNKEIVSENIEREAEVAKANEDHITHLRNVEDRHTESMAAQKKELLRGFRDEKEQLQEEHQTGLKQLELSCQVELSSASSTLEKLKLSHREELDSYKEDLRKVKSQKKRWQIATCVLVFIAVCIAAVCIGVALSR